MYYVLKQNDNLRWEILAAQQDDNTFPDIIMQGDQDQPWSLNNLPLALFIGFSEGINAPVIHVKPRFSLRSHF